MKATAKKKALDTFPLTPDEATFIRRAAQSVWNYIAYDCIEANDNKPMKKADVIEVVMDADRLRVQLRDELAHVKGGLDGLRKLTVAYGEYRDMALWSTACDRVELELEAAFTFSSYC